MSIGEYIIWEWDEHGKSSNGFEEKQISILPYKTTLFIQDTGVMVKPYKKSNSLYPYWSVIVTVREGIICYKNRNINLDAKFILILSLTK